MFSKVVLLVILSLMAGAVAGYYIGYDHGFEKAVVQPPDLLPDGEAVYCTQDVQECQDGSYVGRIGPNCEFAPCPGQ
ncbi:MAG TPA: hypothetical protein VJC05_04700 [Candidatus Andersenbacteria bacterium]|nr:hypothetical protein [Candidatus Andersenbacteria bacterium]